MIALSVLACGQPIPPEPPLPQAYRVALVGDFDYTPEELLISPKLVASIGEADVAFAIHVGDTKNGSSECTDALADATQRQLPRFRPR